MEFFILDWWIFNTQIRVRHQDAASYIPKTSKKVATFWIAKCDMKMSGSTNIFTLYLYFLTLLFNFFWWKLNVSAITFNFFKKCGQLITLTFNFFWFFWKTLTLNKNLTLKNQEIRAIPGAIFQLFSTTRKCINEVPLESSRWTW